MSTMPLLVRREFWEHRAFVIAPAIVAAFWLLLALLLGIFGEFDVRDLHRVMQNHPDLEQRAPDAVAPRAGDRWSARAATWLYALRRRGSRTKLKMSMSRFARITQTERTTRIPCARA